MQLKNFGFLGQILAQIFFFSIVLTTSQAQTQVSAGQDVSNEKLVVITKGDGRTFAGKILSEDAREVLIETKTLGQVYIPRHEIRSIREISSRELNAKDEYVAGEVFSTRYFLSTNGLPIAKGESYMLFTLGTLDAQFGISDNVGAGLMTTWAGAPVIGTLKYSKKVKNDFNVGAGILAGTDTWGGSGLRLLLPYGVLTHGSRRSNVNFSAGYGAIRFKESDKPVTQGRLLISVAGMYKTGWNLSFVFDSFISPGIGTYETYETRYDGFTGTYFDVKLTKQRQGFAMLMPGLRFQTRPDRAFQLGFAGLYFDGNAVPVPLPMLQWFRKL